MKQYQVWYHANCDDGFGAAWAAGKGLGIENIDFHPVSYGEPMPQNHSDQSIFIVDFSYSREELEKLNSEVTKVMVLDHHKTAEEALKGLPFAILDMEKSGAVLSWEYFNPLQNVPILLQYVQDTDLWKHALLGSKELCAWRRSFPMNFPAWDTLNMEMGHNLDACSKEGEAILRAQGHIVNRICARAWTEDWPEGKVVVANCTTHQSEIGQELLNRYESSVFSATYMDLPDRRVWSLRARPDFDVSAVAKARGGGGHAGSSGFIEMK